MSFEPKVGQSGIFILVKPMDIVLTSGIPYRCTAVRLIGDYLSDGVDIYLDTYQLNNIPEEIYKKHVQKNIAIITLQNDIGHSVNVPSDYFKSMPITNGVPYEVKLLGVKLGSLPVKFDLSTLERKINNLCLDEIGVISETKEIIVSAEKNISFEEDKLITAARNKFIKNSITEHAKIIKLERQIEELLIRDTSFSAYIQGLRTNTGPLPPMPPIPPTPPTPPVPEPPIPPAPIEAPSIPVSDVKLVSRTAIEEKVIEPNVTFVTYENKYTGDIKDYEVQVKTVTPTTTIYSPPISIPPPIPPIVVVPTPPVPPSPPVPIPPPPVNPTLPPPTPGKTIVSRVIKTKEAPKAGGYSLNTYLITYSDGSTGYDFENIWTPIPPPQPAYIVGYTVISETKEPPDMIRVRRNVIMSDGTTHMEEYRKLDVNTLTVPYITETIILDTVPSAGGGNYVTVKTNYSDGTTKTESNYVYNNALHDPTAPQDPNHPVYITSAIDAPAVKNADGTSTIITTTNYTDGTYSLSKKTVPAPIPTPPPAVLPTLPAGWTQDVLKGGYANYSTGETASVKNGIASITKPNGTTYTVSVPGVTDSETKATGFLSGWVTTTSGTYINNISGETATILNGTATVTKKDGIKYTVSVPGTPDTTITILDTKVITSVPQANGSNYVTYEYTWNDTTKARASKYV